MLEAVTFETELPDERGQVRILGIGPATARSPAMAAMVPLCQSLCVLVHGGSRNAARSLLTPGAKLGESARAIGWRQGRRDISPARAPACPAAPSSRTMLGGTFLNRLRGALRDRGLGEAIR